MHDDVVNGGGEQKDEHGDDEVVDVVRRVQRPDGDEQDDQTQYEEHGRAQRSAASEDQHMQTRQRLVYAGTGPHGTDICE